MEWVISGILLVIVIILSIKLNKKQTINMNERDSYASELKQLASTRASLDSDIRNKKEQLLDIQSQIEAANYSYNNAMRRKNEDLDQFFENQKSLRQSEMDTEFERQERERQESLNLRMQNFTQQAQERVN